ncbi:glutathione S-transferase family protein [Aspergillus affinis]|uniref:glutathione S-transferase family protein n=1 Tax=Aspergillus affinis TaxID=1070780 RepID=UPI0022FE9D40|nr:glutathione S-transferase [Aspergillus affinis]KAI9038264.1 glutathione S-transferase [Aspergillus affinis]
MADKIIIHHLRVSQSERVIWLCEELNIPYELKSYNRQPPFMLAPQEYRELHPAGTAPIIEDGPMVLAESNAIFEYLLAKYGKGRLVLQPDHPNYADYLFWLHHSNGGMMPSFMGVMMKRLSGQPDDGSRPNVSQERFDRSMAALEQQLSKFPYVGGDQFTAADILVFFPLTTGRMFAGMSLDPYPNVVSYLQRVGNREAYRRAMEKGDPGLEPLLAANPPRRSVL